MRCVSSDNNYLPLRCRPARLTLSPTYPVPIKFLLSGGASSTACRTLRHWQADCQCRSAVDSRPGRRSELDSPAELESPRPQAEPP